MGWLTTNRKGELLYYGDETLDACADLFKGIGAEYRESELGRLPTLAEILLNLETVLSAHLGAYCSDGDGFALSSLTAKKKKMPKKKKVAVGDILGIPLTRDLFAFAQVYTTVKDWAGIIGVYPLVSPKPVNAASLLKLQPIAQVQTQYSGVVWNHWQIIGQAPVAPTIHLKKFPGNSPCFRAEMEILEALQKHGCLEKTLRLYGNIPASSPKLQPVLIQKLTIFITFLREKGLLSPEGLREIKTGSAPPDFSMHSGLLTEQGGRFYDVVFKKDLMTDYFYTDTAKKIAALWEEFEGGSRH